MTPTLVFVALVGLVCLATVLGLVQRAATGRVRRAGADHRHQLVRARDLPGVARLGTGATLVQFSTEVCSPCKATHRILDRLANDLDGVAHVDLDVTHRPELASRYRVLQTPTTLILDHRGIVRARIGGAPRPTELRAELDRVLATA